jgi:hypothetical protein
MSRRGMARPRHAGLSLHLATGRFRSISGQSIRQVPTYTARVYWVAAHIVRMIYIYEWFSIIIPTGERS